MNSVEQLESDTVLHSLLDEEVLRKVKNGCEMSVEYLLKKYESTVRKKANTYFLIGSEHDDVVQEGFIGLYKAICDYDQSKRASFSSFAELCITRQIITSIKSATRQKHQPLNSYVSLYKPVHDDNPERTLLDTIISQREKDPQYYLLLREKREYIKNKLMKALTKLERDVLSLYLQGCSYDEIARQLKRQEKSVDNALQRVKRKVSRLIDEQEFLNE